MDSRFLKLCQVIAAGALTLGLAACSTPSPRFAYVANFEDDTVSIYTVNARTGQLRANGYVTTINAPGFNSNPSSVAIDSTGHVALVVNDHSNAVSVYGINASTGALTSIGTPVATGTRPHSIAVDPAAPFAYVANWQSNNVSAYMINATNGTLAPIANFPAGNGPWSVIVDPTGKFAYVANLNSNDVSAYSIGTDGALGQISCAGASTGGCSTTNPANFSAGLFPRFLTIDPTGKYIYVANSGSGDISAYRIDRSFFFPKSAGALVQISCTFALTGGCSNTNRANFAAGTGPHSVTVDPTGKFAYVANADSDDISAYEIAQSSIFPPRRGGALTRISCASVGTGGCATNQDNFAAGAHPSFVTIDPSGRFAYVANNLSNNINIYSINPRTGALIPLGTMAARSYPTSIAFVNGKTPATYTPKFAYVATGDRDQPSDEVDTYAINANTGALSFVGMVAAGAQSASITVDPTGRFADVANWGSDDVYAYAINPSTGALTNVGTAQAGVGTGAVTIDPSGRFAYVANFGAPSAMLPAPGSLSTYTIDSSTGALTNTGTVAVGEAGTDSIAVDPTGRFVYVANDLSNNISAYTVDPSTGALASVGAAVAAGTHPLSVAVDPTGKFAYVANADSQDVSAYRIDGTSDATFGGLTQISCAKLGMAGCSSANPDNFMAGTYPRFVTVEPTGRFLYVANVLSNNVSVYAINANTGALTSEGTMTAGTAPQSISVDPTGQFAYVANSGSNDVSIYTINPGTGALTSAGMVPAGRVPSSITTIGTIQ